MARNEILEEIYAAREALLAEHDGDVHAYVEAARKRALESGRPLAEPKKRSARSVFTTDNTVADEPTSQAGR